MSTKKDNFSLKDKKYMQIAINLAKARKGLTGENPSVGCLIVKDDKIMMVQYVLAILLIIAMIVLDLYKSANGFSNIEPFHINRCGGVFVVLLVMGFFLH